MYGTSNVKIEDVKLFTHQVKYGFHCADFHETRNVSINFCAHPLYLILSKLDEKFREYGQNFIYSLK
jgi:hypothetical protein